MVDRDLLDATGGLFKEVWGKMIKDEQAIAEGQLAQYRALRRRKLRQTKGDVKNQLGRRWHVLPEEPATDNPNSPRRSVHPQGKRKLRTRWQERKTMKERWQERQARKHPPPAPPAPPAASPGEQLARLPEKLTKELGKGAMQVPAALVKVPIAIITYPFRKSDD